MVPASTLVTTSIFTAGAGVLVVVLLEMQAGLSGFVAPPVDNYVEYGASMKKRSNKDTDNFSSR
jgi:hypothetical protein